MQPTWTRRTATCSIRTTIELGGEVRSYRYRVVRQLRVLGLLLFGPLLAMPVVAEHLPEAPGGVVELENHARVFFDLGDFDPMLELSWRFEDEDFEFRRRALMVGSYYRLIDNLKVGAFYKLQAGARHDDDWIDLNPGWEWRDTTDRYESLLVADISPRFLLEFIPGEDWVLMVKNRYLYNTYNGEQTALVRPSLTYFHLVDREPRFNVSAAYGAYFSLNFGDTLLYRRGPYLSFLYRLSPGVLLDASVARETTTWSTSDDVQSSGESGYTVDYSRWVLSAGVIVRVR